MGRTPAGETRRRIYEFVRARLLDGTPPTVREVQEAFGFRAVQSAREHLEALVSEGLLSKEPGRARGYRLPDLSTSARTSLDGRYPSEGQRSSQTTRRVRLDGGRSHVLRCALGHI